MNMSAVSVLARDVVRRRIVLASPGSSIGIRAFHGTFPGLFLILPCFDSLPVHTLIELIASRKSRSIPDPSDAEDTEDDLFPASDTPSTSANTSDRSARRHELIQIISAASILPSLERRRAMSNTRVGTLRKIVQFSDTPEELEEIRGALRGWRVMGMRVTAKTAEEIVGGLLYINSPFSHRG